MKRPRLPAASDRRTLTVVTDAVSVTRSPALKPCPVITSGVSETTVSFGLPAELSEPAA
jgi:hypothetical protein